MFFLYKERTKEIPNQYNHRTGQLPSLRQLPGFGLCMDVSGVECRAASPLAAARGVLPCGANLFLKGAIGGKKCEYPTNWNILSCTISVFYICNPVFQAIYTEIIKCIFIANESAGMVFLHPFQCLFWSQIRMLLDITKYL